MTFDTLRCDDFFEDRSLVNLDAKIEANRSGNRTDEEGHAPSPGQHGFGIQHSTQDSRSERTSEHTGGGAGLLPASDQSALVGWCVFHHERSGAAPFSACRESLSQPAEQQQQGCEPPNGVVGREKADAERRDSHNSDSEYQSRLSSVSIAVGAYNDRAYGAHEKANAVDGQAAQK